MIQPTKRSPEISPDRDKHLLASLEDYANKNRISAVQLALQMFGKRLGELTQSEIQRMRKEIRKII
jgi:hypothetical protein